jgi:UDP:flavonoid glycosyltransferase YjiC (YdhE family)
VRFLFSFAGGTGHFVPTAVFARALARRGHEILYCCQEGMVATVTAAGWSVQPTGGATLLAESTRRPLAPVDRQAEERVMRNSFAGKVARERAHRLGEVIDKWRPDMVVRDEVDFGAAIAAEAAGLPHAAVMVIAAGQLARPEVIEPALAVLRSEFRLDPDQASDALHRYLMLVPIPPSFRDPELPLPATARYVRPAVLEEVTTRSTGERSPSDGVANVPQVYFTLGTIFPRESGDLFQRVVAGLSTLSCEVTVTTGDAIDSAELGPHSGRIRIEQFLPLAETLACSDLVVSHGGSGTVISSLALGLPQVLLPMGADQPDNADRCQRLRVGVHLDPMSASPADIATAVTSVLEDPQFRTAAQGIADEARSLADADYGASLLEAVAQTNSSITSLDPQPNARETG